MIGDSYDDREYKWLSAVLASDGFIYCIPYNANDTLSIDSHHINQQIIEIICKINSINIFQLPSYYRIMVVQDFEESKINS